MRLVGRDHEIDQIDGLLGRSAAGSGGLLVLTGPSGAGKSALADLAVERSQVYGLAVLRAAPSVGQPGRLLWSQLLRDVGAVDAMATRLLEGAQVLDLDDATRVLASSTPRLIVIDDIDRGGPECVEVLSVLASRLHSTCTAVLATTTAPLGVGIEVSLGPLGDEGLQVLLGEHGAELRHALGVASGGMPGIAVRLAAQIKALGAGVDPVVSLALTVGSRAQFLAVDRRLVRLLEVALERKNEDGQRARLLARLAHELLGDATAGERRRTLITEAVRLARRTGRSDILAEVLEAQLHALWEPEAAGSRLVAAQEIIDRARAAGDGARERRGLFWRFIALVELGRVADAESVLAAFETESALAGDAAALVMVTARHAMLAIMRGSYDEASRLVETVAEMGRSAGMADAGQLSSTLFGMIGMERGTPEQAARAVAVLRDFARRQPGHYYEATTAAILAGLGRDAEARAELERVMPRVLPGSGPRWLGAIASLAFVAAETRDAASASKLYDALVPYDGRLVTSGGAVLIMPPVAHFLGLLAASLDRVGEAVAYFEAAIVLEEQIGALPYLSRSLLGLADVLTRRGARGDRSAAMELYGRARSIAERLGMTLLLESLERTSAWRLVRDDLDWLLEAGPEQLRLRDSRGLHHLRALLAAPNLDIPCLDLVAGGTGLVATSTGVVVDAAARDAYRARLVALEARLDEADHAGDTDAAERIGAEREALVLELRRAVGLGGRPRTGSPEAERARINVTRTLRATLDLITLSAPLVGAHLRASITTGTACRYSPGPGGPPAWQV